MAREPTWRRVANVRLPLVALVVVGLAHGLAGCRPVREAPRTSPIPDESVVPQSAVETAAPAEVPPAVAGEEAATASEDPAGPVVERTEALRGHPGSADEEPGVDEDLTVSPLDELAEVEPGLLASEPSGSAAPLVDPRPSFDIPIVVNAPVLAWIDHYTQRERESVHAALERSGRYLPMFREIFAEAGLPRDLVFMALVESGYKTTAYSRARARGIFQFMSGTARLYGLKIDYWVDERLDPEKSARAATAYLRRLHDEFDDWYLALAAYNAGEGRIRRAIASSGARDFWSLARTSHIRRETKNHVPAILAATLISKNPAAYGFEIQPDAPIEYETVEVDGAVDLRVLARCASVEAETLRRLNPALRRTQTPPQARTQVRVPVGSGEAALARLREIPRSQRVLHARHRVRRGETLSGLAAEYGVSVPSIQRANRLGRSTLIRAGQVLVIPTTASIARVDGSFENSRSASEVENGWVTYRVRRGDTLYGIAKRYGTSPQAIAAASEIEVDQLLRVGQRLRVTPRVRSATRALELVRAAPRADAMGSGESPVREGAIVHTVRRGDSLWRIAARYGTTIDELCRVNGISRHDLLHPGTKLTVQSR